MKTLQAIAVITLSWSIHPSAISIIIGMALYIGLQNIIYKDDYYSSSIEEQK